MITRYTKINRNFTTKSIKMVPFHKTKIYSLLKVSFIFLFILHAFAKSDISSEEGKTLVESGNGNSDFDLKNFTFTLHNNSNVSLKSNFKEVDCFGLGTTIAKALEYFFIQEEQKTSSLYAHFYMLSRKKPNRVHVYTGDQFGLEWTDFNIRRKTVVIVHGFLSNGNEVWIQEMEKAFLLWGDVNIIVVDWSEGSNTWNYYKAVVNTRVVGSLIAKLFEHIANATIDSQGPHENEWGELHFVGHSLGAHIGSFAANAVMKLPNKWKVGRITGLDPAQPCFRNADMDLLLDRSDAPFVDVIHTNGKFLTSLGLGLPKPIGHVDFYPNGGKTQPGCARLKPIKFLIPIPQTAINQAICSHGRSYTYFTESILASVENNCTFWAHHWDLTYRRVVAVLEEKCTRDTCSEMGINSVNYRQRGTFFILTSGSMPYCSVNESDKEEVLHQLRQDLQNEVDD